MYIIINGANASENKLGSVELPLNPIAETTNYLNAIDSAGFSNAKKQVFDSFFRGLVTSGLTGKLQRVYLPKLGRVDGGVNMISPFDANINFPVSGATYSAGGVLFSTPWVMPFTLPIADSYAAAYNSEVVPVTGSFERSLDNGNSSLMLGRRLAGGFTDGAVLLTSSARANITGSGPLIGLYAASIHQGGNYIKFATNNQLAVKTPSTITSWTSYTRMNANQVPHALYAFGAALSDAEMGLFEDYAEALVSGLDA